MAEYYKSHYLCKFIQTQIMTINVNNYKQSTDHQ